MFYTNTFVGGEVNVVGKRRRETKKKGNKKQQKKTNKERVFFTKYQLQHQYM
jgi:hypothetical protein